MVSTGRLLERDSELARLGELARAAADGRGSWAGVAGPAGIGKTSLLAVARELAERRGMAVLVARGGELERDYAYGVARQLFEGRLRGMSDADRSVVLDGAAARAAAPLGLAAGDAAEPPFAVLHGLYWACANLAAGEPLALFVDDLHWADAASVRFLAYLGRRIEELPVLIVTAARPPVDAAQADLLETVAADAGMVALAPSPLSEGAVGELVRSIRGKEPDAALVAACHRASAGNPFLCTLVAALGELPAGSALEAITRRLGRLSGAATGLARAVAVLGTEVPLRDAAALAGMAAPEAADAHASLVGQGVLRPRLPLEFEHPLVRAAVREGIPAAERALLHARAARLLRDRGGSAEMVATQLLAAEPAAETWAARALRSAAVAAEAMGDPDAAAVFLRRALAEPPADEERAAVLHDLASAELRAGRPGAAVERLAEACRVASDLSELVACRRLHASALLVQGRYDAARASMEEALGELTPGDDLALELEAELEQMASIEPKAFAASRARFERPGYEPEGRTRGERAYLAALTTGAFFAIRPSGEVLTWGRRALDAGVFEDHRAGSVVWNNLAYPLIFSDAFDLIAAAADESVEEARRRGSVVGAVRAHAVRAVLHLRTGALRDAIEDARIAADTGREAGVLLAALALGALVEALAAHGDLAAADAALERFGLQGPVPETFHECWALHGRGWLRLAQDRPADAAADFRELRRREERWLPWNPAIYAYRSGLAHALLRLGDRVGAAAVAAEELELSRRWGTRRAIGVSLRACGLVAGGPRGLGLLRRSVESLDGSGAALEHARSLVELGAAIRRAGRRADAREPLAAGMELAHRCAAEPLARRAREELVATGARPRRMLRTGVDALTASELRVARMAVAGMTNREIAQALFVTLRTVQTHLTHAYAKLDIASREGLPAALAGDRASLSRCATAPAEGCRSG